MLVQALRRRDEIIRNAHARAGRKVETPMTLEGQAADEIERLREALASCVPVVEAVMEDHGWLGDHEGIEGALEATGLIAWNVVPPSGEIHTHFEGWEDLEPGDSFWTATKKWGAVWALAKRLPETAK